MASHKTYNRNTPKGFTLIEMVIAIGLLAILASLGLVVSMDNYRGHSFRDERDVVVSALQKARSRAISNVCKGESCDNGKPHGVFLRDQEYVIFQGSSYLNRDERYDEVIVSNAGAVELSGVDEIVFSRLSGSVEETGLITVSDKTGRSSDIYINNEGLITWTN
jgi:prepilin-type N-terminal cleavage/methylation domain-containing protein